jgi:hypothetical protein
MTIGLFGMEAQACHDDVLSLLTTIDFYFCSLYIFTSTIRYPPEYRPQRVLTAITPRTTLHNLNITKCKPCNQPPTHAPTTSVLSPRPVAPSPPFCQLIAHTHTRARPCILLVALCTRRCAPRVIRFRGAPVPVPSSPLISTAILLAFKGSLNALA